MPSESRYEPHRGTLIMVLGILSLFTAPIILGPIAWIMGNADMKKIREGAMDPEGESQTNIGRICGMVATILGLVGVVFCCVIGLFYSAIIGLVIGGAAMEEHRHREGQPPDFKFEMKDFPKEDMDRDELERPKE
jgi:predicted benzoate:H+ symporter BenE